MLRRVLLVAIAAPLLIPFTARAQTKPDFSGTWTRDDAKSDKEMTIEAVTRAPQGDIKRKIVFTKS